MSMFPTPRLAVFALALLLGLALAACPPGREDAAARFNAFVERYLEWGFEAYPHHTTAIGNHEHDSEMPDMSAEAIEARHDRIMEFIAELEAIDPAQLDAELAVDYEMLLNELLSEDFSYTEIAAHRNNPLIYVGLATGPVYGLMKRDFAPLDERLRSAISRMEAVPELLEQARANLVEGPPRIYTEVAIRRNAGAVAFYRDVLPEQVRASAADDGLKLEFIGIAEETADAIEDFGIWLTYDLLPHSDGDWRLGAERFDRKFSFLGTDMSPEETLARAEAEFAAVREEMRLIAAQHWSEFFPDTDMPDDPDEAVRMVMDVIAAQHAEPENVLPRIREVIDELKLFIAESGIIELPEPDRLEVIQMPEFQAGSAIGYLDQPPPLEPEGGSFFAVTPFPPSWGADRVESFLREYNDRMVQILTIHEAYPGHFVQGWYAGFLDSPVRKIFGSGVYAEGWAVYCEWMMLDEGFGGGDPGLRLQRLKFYLRAVANAIIDPLLHKGLMAEEELVDFLVNEAFQERTEAEEKLTRARLSSVQLSTYFIGFQEMMDLRRDYEEAAGENFDIGEFHLQVLNHGAPPPRLLRRLILPESETEN